MRYAGLEVFTTDEWHNQQVLPFWQFAIEPCKINSHLGAVWFWNIYTLYGWVRILGAGILLENTPPHAINHSLQQQPKKGNSKSHRYCVKIDPVSVGHNAGDIWSWHIYTLYGLVRILGAGIPLANTPPCAINHSLQQKVKKATTNLTDVE